MSNEAMTNAERRRVRRHQAWFPVRFDAPGSGGTALARNVSAHGVLLATRRSIEVGSPLTLRVLTDPARGGGQALTGRVVRVTPNTDDPNSLWPYKMAVEFEQPQLDLMPLVLGN